jgi:hypothetical protein
VTAPRRRYRTDLTDAQWRILAPLIPAPKPGGRPAVHQRRELLNAMLYWLRAGCAWRLLPDRIGVLDHVDYRAADRYVVAPPSRHPETHRPYTWVAGRGIDTPLGQVPAALLKRLAPPRIEPAAPAPTVRPVAPGHPYGQQALALETAAIATATRGRRNRPTSSSTPSPSPCGARAPRGPGSSSTKPATSTRTPSVPPTRSSRTAIQPPPCVDT